MTSQGKTYSRTRRPFGWAVPAVLLAVGQVWAQVQNPAQVIGDSSTDVYGNARPWRAERRIVGSFSHDVQYQATQGLQDLGMRVNQRGAQAGFSVAGDLFGQSRSVRYRAAPVFGAPTYAAQRTFAQYGGFGRRVRSTYEGDMSAVFSRRYALIEATSRAAPVRRALMRRGLRSVEGEADEGAPRLPTEGVADMPTAEPTLDEELSRGVSRSHGRVRDDAWAFFKDGEYRRAARAFESASAMEPTDYESRIGEIFCYASVGALRTATVLLGSLSRRDPNPFRHDLRVDEFFEDPIAVREIQLRCRVFSRSNHEVADASALYPFVSWFVGQREEAVSAAGELVRVFEGTTYADWPRLMRSAGETAGGTVD